MTRQFDVAEKGTELTLDEAEKELRDLVKGIDIEEILAKANQDEADVEDDDDEILCWSIEWL